MMLSGFAVIAGLSVTGSVMILILLIAKKVLKKRHGVSRRAFVFLWLLIFLRMCLPFGVDLLQPAENTVLPGQAVYSVLTEQMAAETAADPDDSVVLAADPVGEQAAAPAKSASGETVAAESGPAMTAGNRRTDNA